MPSPLDDPTIKMIDSLLDRLWKWHSDAATLANDADVRDRVNHALLDVSYIFEYLKTARSEKEQKLKKAG